MKNSTPRTSQHNNCLNVADSLWNTKLTLVFTDKQGEVNEKAVILLGVITQKQLDILIDKAINGNQIPARHLASLLEDELEADNIVNERITIKELADNVTDAQALHTKSSLTVAVPVGAVIAGLAARSRNQEHQTEGEDNDDDLFRQRVN